MLSNQNGTKPCSKLSEHHDLIKKRLGAGTTQSQICDELKVAKSTLSDYILNNKDLLRAKKQVSGQVEKIETKDTTTLKQKNKREGNIDKNVWDNPEEFGRKNNIDLEKMEVEKAKFIEKEDVDGEVVEKSMEVQFSKREVLYPTLSKFDLTIPKFNKMRIKKEDGNYETVLIISDLHIPFLDRKMWALFLIDVINTRPDKIIINGDFLNFDALARHAKKKFTQNDTQAEINEGGYRLWELREACKQTGKYVEIIYIEGNHDQWLINYNVREAADSTNLKKTHIPGQPKVKNPQLTVPELLELEHFDVQWMGDFPHDRYVLFNKLQIKHRSAIRAGVLTSPQQAMRRKNTAVMAGDTHRFGVGFERREDTWGNPILYQFAETGCMCDLNPEYMDLPADWANGYITAIGNKETDNYHLLMNHWNRDTETLFTAKNGEIHFKDIADQVDLEQQFYDPTY